MPWTCWCCFSSPLEPLWTSTEYYISRYIAGTAGPSWTSIWRYAFFLIACNECAWHLYLGKLSGQDWHLKRSTKNFFTVPTLSNRFLIYKRTWTIKPGRKICNISTSIPFNKSRMTFTTLTFLLCLFGVTNAHFRLLYPLPRGNFVADQEPNFCGVCLWFCSLSWRFWRWQFFSGGYTEVTTNRTTFPLSGGFFSIKAGHPNWTGLFFQNFDEKIFTEKSFLQAAFWSQLSQTPTPSIIFRLTEFLSLSIHMLSRRMLEPSAFPSTCPLPELMESKMEPMLPSRSFLMEAMATSTK